MVRNYHLDLITLCLKIILSCYRAKYCVILFLTIVNSVNVGSEVSLNCVVETERYFKKLRCKRSYYWLFVWCRMPRFRSRGRSRSRSSRRRDRSRSARISRSVSRELLGPEDAPTVVRKIVESQQEVLYKWLEYHKAEVEEKLQETTRWFADKQIEKQFHVNAKFR